MEIVNTIALCVFWLGFFLKVAIEHYSKKEKSDKSYGPKQLLIGKVISAEKEFKSQKSKDELKEKTRIADEKEKGEMDEYITPNWKRDLKIVDFKYKDPFLQDGTGILIILQNSHGKLVYKDFKFRFRYLAESGTELTLKEDKHMVHPVYKIIGPSQRLEIHYAHETPPQTKFMDAELVGAQNL